MNRFKRGIKTSIVIALTYVLCAASLLQPMAVYAATLQAQQPAAEATGEASTQDGSAADTSDNVADGAGENGTSAATTEDEAGSAEAADEDETAGGEDAPAAESLDAEGEQAADDTVIGDSEANSWRYQNGELRGDLQDDNATDLGIESRSMHEMPEGATLQGIDVSGYQKDIDWRKVKDAGIDFAILKIGNINARETDGWYTDSYFQRNVTECERLGIPYGVYAYSYAKNADEAVKGADHIIALLKGHNPTLPVYLDLEDDSIKDTDHASIAKAFCNTISAAGYTPGIYASASWFKNILTDPCFSNSGWNIWTAQYWYGQRYDASLGLGPEYPAKFDCWQYSSLSTVPGIDGYCDINYWYKDGFSINDGNPHISYRAHVAGIGWQASVEDGATAGTTGRSLALEALRVSLSGSDYSDGSSVQVDAHVSGIGWQGWDSPSPSEGGTTGQSRAVEAVRLRLTGELADDYDVWYRVHASNIGWMGWAKDGEDAGTTGLSCPIEAVQVRLVRRGDPAPSADDSDVDYAFKKKPMCVSYRAHVAGIGWQASVEDGATAGTTGRSLALEALRVSLSGSDYSDGSSVQVDAHVSGIGWQGWDSPSPSEGGTTGQSRAVEAVRLRLTGELADDYDVWYRVHASNIGWMGWAKDGEDAGTTGLSCPIEAVQVRLVKKGGEAPGSTASPSVSAPVITYKSLISSGWQNEVAADGISGVAGQGSIHAFELRSSSDISSSFKYRVHLSDLGWQDYVSQGSAGSTDSHHAIQAIQIAPTGDFSKKFDIYYRVYVDKLGWLGWAKNGASAGTTSCCLDIQAVQVCVRVRGTKALGGGIPFYSSKATLPYIGFQNPGQYYQVSNRSVSIKNMGAGIFGYRTESRIPYNASREDCINAMITRAYDYVGTTPYIWNYSCAPGVGVDCAGLVMQCLYATGMDFGRYNPWDHYYTPGHDHYANDMWSDLKFKHLDFSQRQRGDLICYNGHIAIYLGNDLIIEAASPRYGVRVHSVYVGYSIRGVLRPFV